MNVGMGSSAGSGEAWSSGSRPGGDALTTDRPSFGDVWPAVSTALSRYLARRGATSAQTQDISQDVALKALLHDVQFSSAQDLLRWCYPVARNGLVDAQRAASRVALLPSLGSDEGLDVADGSDLHRTVESRLRLLEVVQGIRQLSHGDREALAPLLLDEEPAAPADRRESTRLAVRRHRARARLLAKVGQAAAAIAWAFGSRSTRTSSRLMPAAATASLSVTLLVGVGALTAPTPDPVPLPSIEAASGSSQLPVHAGDIAPDAAQPVAARPLTAAPPTTHAELPTEVVATSGVAVSTGTRAARGRELVCVTGLPSADETCVDRPVDAPTTPETASVTDAGLPT